MTQRNENITLLLIVIITLIICVIHIGTSHAYTIVDTVYVAPTPDSITVTMSMEEWQEYLEWFVPDSGRSGWGGITIPATCQVYGFLYNISGDPETDATITAWLPSDVIQCSNNTDSAGYYYLNLIPGSEYEITITRPDGMILRKQAIIPDLTSWLLVW